MTDKQIAFHATKLLLLHYPAATQLDLNLAWAWMGTSQQPLPLTEEHKAKPI